MYLNGEINANGMNQHKWPEHCFSEVYVKLQTFSKDSLPSLRKFSTTVTGFHKYVNAILYQI